MPILNTPADQTTNINIPIAHISICGDLKDLIHLFNLYFMREFS